MASGRLHTSVTYCAQQQAVQCRAAATENQRLLVKNRCIYDIDSGETPFSDTSNL